MSNETTGRWTQRIDLEASREDQAAAPAKKPFTGKKKYHNLYGQLTERPRLRAAFDRVKANRGAPA